MSRTDDPYPPHPRSLPTPTRGARRRAPFWAALALALGSLALAQDGPSPAELRRMYDDVVGQLKNAQDRKNELAGENDRLKKQTAEIESRVKVLEARNAELERDATTYAERTYQFRSIHAAWLDFTARNPEVRQSWERFLRSEPGNGGPGQQPATWLSRTWPLREG